MCFPANQNNQLCDEEDQDRVKVVHQSNMKTDVQLKLVCPSNPDSYGLFVSSNLFHQPHRSSDWIRAELIHLQLNLIQTESKVASIGSIMTGIRKPLCSWGCVVGSDYPLCSSLTSVQCCIIVSHPGEVVWWDLVTPCPRVLSLCTPAFRATHPKQMLYNLTPFYIFSPTLTVTRVVREIACYMKDFVTPCLECPVQLVETHISHSMAGL